ncbi:periplasmic diheme shuttle PdsA [Aeromonas cavernicola]|uniref:Cytochrome c-553 n=1 Tax=Aeromonas cavernicola TaxID=1006623 RepID=A0A2H9U0P2_9GAMM|nr:c-type cytochrome [Aeromonas cavernicola]PJG57549.1 cytochrome c-553 [Aeromonas cavernicola]
MKLKALLAMSLMLGPLGVASANVDGPLKTCAACHGEQGVSSHTDIPTIAGLAEANIGDQLRTYLDGRPAKTVKHVSGDTSKQGNMSEVVKGLNEAQIDELAAHFAALPYTAMKQPFDAAKAAAGQKLHKASCEKCHSGGGSVAEDESSILAGQPKGYLLTSLQEYQGGKRTADKNMTKALSGMSSADLEALAEFYASQQ